MDDHLDGYYYTGQTPFRKPNESAFRFHARRLVAIQTLGRLEYQVEEAETKFNRALGPVELTFVGLGKLGVVGGHTEQTGEAQYTELFSSRGILLALLLLYTSGDRLVNRHPTTPQLHPLFLSFILSYFTFWVHLSP
jgi:hypothetical protein